MDFENNSKRIHFSLTQNKYYWMNVESEWHPSLARRWPADWLDSVADLRFDHLSERLGYNIQGISL